MSLGKRIRELREERGQTRGQLAVLLGVSYWALSKWETDERRPDHEALVRLSEHFGVSVDWLLGHGIRHAPTTSAIAIPILGHIKAGVPILAEENWDGEVEVPAGLKADFALRVSGDSMSWAGIAAGDMAILKKAEGTSTAPNGAVVAAIIEESTWEATLKFYVRENGHAVLRAANPEYKDIPVGSKLKIIGLLVTLLKNPPAVSDYLAHLVHKDISDRKWQYAIALATQAGLDGESVANIISAVMKTAKQMSK